MRLYFIRTLAVSLFLQIGCNSDNAMAPDVQPFIYPIKVGNQWQYKVTVSVQDFHPSSPGNTFDDSIITSMATVEIIGLDTLEAKEVHVFRELENQFERTAHYRNEASGMFLFQGFFDDVLPKTSAGINPRAWEMNLNSIRHSALPLNANVSLRSLKEKSLQILKYPLQIGEQWLVDEGSSFGHVIRIVKKISGTETVKVTAGEFDCFKIEWFIRDDQMLRDNIEQFDFVAAEGLIKRVNVFKGITITTESSPEPIGTADIRMETELTSLQLL